MRNFRFQFYLAFVLLSFQMAASLGMGQFKKVYDLDTLLYPLPPALFNAAKVVETDLPGREISIMGAFYGNDSGTVSRQAAFHLMSNLQGESVRMDCYEDSASFLFLGPRVYAACYDGNANFCLGLGSNNRQVVMKIDSSGQMLWSKGTNHHDFYSMVCEGQSVVALGQDESNIGAHDFSLVRMEANGTSSGQGMMYGTIGFELPEKVIRDDNKYLMVGSSFAASSEFGMMLVKAHTNFNQIWGKVYGLAGKNVFCDGVIRSTDGDHYFVGGRVRGGNDSLFVAQTDTSGNLLWTKFYGINGASEIYMAGMTMDPVSGGLLLCGQYRGVQYLRPFVLKTDGTGDLEWVRDYGDPGNASDEGLNDIVYCNADGYFYAVGDYLEIDSPAYNHKIMMVKASPDSGAIPCDVVLAAGQSVRTMVLLSQTAQEPFANHTSYSMGYSFSTTTATAVRCSVMVGLPEQLPLDGKWTLVNPTMGDLHMQAELPLGGGRLRVFTLAGQVVHEEWLAEGMQRHCVALGELAGGMYLVTLAGEGWAYPAKKWLVQK